MYKQNLIQLFSQSLKIKKIITSHRYSNFELTKMRRPQKGILLSLEKSMNIHENKILNL